MNAPVIRAPAIRHEQRQHQTLTPRLQQAVRLLQLSSLDFAQEVSQAMGNNPFLEMDEAPEGESTVAAPGSDASSQGKWHPRPPQPKRLPMHHRTKLGRAMDGRSMERLDATTARITILISPTLLRPICHCATICSRSQNGSLRPTATGR